MSVEFYQHPFSPFCRSVSLVASLIGVKLDTVIVNLFEKEQLKPEYLEKNPFHQVPTINDNGFYLSESRAILTYLVDKYAADHSLYPKDLQTRAVINQMLYFDSGTLAPALQGLIRPVFYQNKHAEPEAVDKATEVLKTLDLVLSKRKYVAGDSLSIADIAIRVTLTMNELLGRVDLSEFKNVTAWAKKVRDETSPAYGEVNDEPVGKFKEILKQKVAQIEA